MRQFKNILVTGGCGFIGSNFIRYILQKTDYKGSIINIDALTYAGNRENLLDIEEQYKDRYFFEKVNICDDKKIDEIFNKYNPDCIIHFAAESHVDRSIYGPKDFIEYKRTPQGSLYAAPHATGPSGIDVPEQTRSLLESLLLP